jgi:hypothetical protein
MADGRTKAAWEHTAHILWMIYAVNRTERAPEKLPSDFNPTVKRKKRKADVKVEMSGLRKMWGL